MFEEDDGKRRWPKRLLIVLGIVVALVAVYVGASFALADRVPRGATVAGVDIGGLSSAEAVTRLDAGPVERDDHADRGGRQRHPGDDRPRHRGPHVRRAGHGGRRHRREPRRAAAALGAPGRRRRAGSGDARWTRTRWRRRSGTWAPRWRWRPSTAPSSSSTGRRSRRPRSTGRTSTRPAAADVLAVRLARGGPPDRAADRDGRARITQAETDAALSDAQQVTSAPVAVVVEERTATLDAPTLAANASFVPTDGDLALQMNGEGLTEVVLAQLPDLLTESADAHFEFVDGAPRIIPGTPGTTLDPVALAGERRDGRHVGRPHRHRRAGRGRPRRVDRGAGGAGDQGDRLRVLHPAEPRDPRAR